MLSRSSSLHLTLVVPGLMQALEAVAGEGLRLPRLERLVGRARSEAIAASPYEPLLFSLFGLSSAETRDVPLAAVMYSWDKGCAPTQSGWWLRADPAYLQADRDRLVLFGPRHLGLTQAEIHSLASTVAPLFTEYGWQFEALQPERWYLRLPQPEAVTFSALSKVEGRDVESGLPSGPRATRWRTLLNEIQMTLHDCPANREREARGAWPVNSLWFWGAGEPPRCSNLSWRQVAWGQEPLLPALATYCGIPGGPVPQEASTWLAQAPTSGHCLLVLDSLLQVTEPMHYRDIFLALEKDWFKVLGEALQYGRLASLTFYPLNGRCYHLTWSRIWRLWRRSRPLPKVLWQNLPPY